MHSLTELFQINGNPILAPDAEVSVNYEDIDGADAGRDQAGFMHRSMLRCKVPSWTFTYTWLTEEEKNYMESLFGQEAAFVLTHPSRLDAKVAEQTQCYRSKYGICWRSAKSGLWGNYSFTVIAC